MATKKRKNKYGTDQSSYGKRYYYKKKTNRKWRAFKEEPVMPYDDAKEIVRGEGLQSKHAYYRWHKMYEIQQIPRYPDVCYTYRDKWEGWNVWLGHNKTFSTPAGRYRRFEEALVYAHSTPANTKNEWLELKHPENIPKRPDVVYKGKFLGWRHFLGTGNKKASNIVQLEKAKENIPYILIIGKHLQSPPNEYIISVVQGEAKSREYIKDNNIIVQKAYYLDENYNWRGIVNRYCSDMGDGCYVCNNINELLFEIPLLWCQL